MLSDGAVVSTVKVLLSVVAGTLSVVVLVRGSFKVLPFKDNEFASMAMPLVSVCPAKMV